MKKIFVACLPLVFRTTAALIPTWILGIFFRRSTQNLSLAFCLHRISSAQRPGNAVPATTTAPEIVDGFLAFIERYAPHSKGGPRITLGFDDGYHDSAEYIASRAPLHPSVEWIFFVCPEKIVKRAAFRWDAYEILQKQGMAAADLVAFAGAAVDEAQENQRADLLHAATLPEFRLATVDDCRALTHLPNVKLGNHTNLHMPLTSFSENGALAEIRRSMESFGALFGPCKQFAFPFGVPHLHWRPNHAQFIRSNYGAQMWSTREAPYTSSARAAGDVLPRFVFDTRWTAKSLALWVCWRSLRRKKSAR